jgi:oligopeptide/dipeptide ABC transporter ATP-binding protein
MILQFQFETGATMMFVLGLILTQLVSVFFINSGDKMQLMASKRLLPMIIITSILPTAFLIVSYMIYSEILDDLETYFDNAYVIISISMVLLIITGLIVKYFAYKTIPLKKIREIRKLEKGQILLEAKDLRVYYPLLLGLLRREVGSVKAVDGVSFTIRTGETLGLVGESGCGKSTIALNILGLVPTRSGQVFYKGELIPPKYSKELRQKIQIVFQDPDASLNPRLKVVDIIAEPLKNLLGITDKQEVRKHVLRLMDQVSLKREHMDRYPHEFSGGQKQRIVIARALACNPELIILDEPTSALDVSVQAQILNLLRKLQSEYGYGFLFITHDLSVAHHIADDIAVMYLGKFVETGQVDKIFAHPTHPYSRALLASRPEIDPEDRTITFTIKGEIPSPIFPPSGCYFNPRCNSENLESLCSFEMPELKEVEKNHFVRCHFSERDLKTDSS